LRRSLAAIKAPQSDASSQLLAIPINQRFGQWMSAIEFRLAVTTHNQDSLVACLAQQVSQQPKRATIRPMQIIHKEKQPVLPGEV
jgi:hypothetical protein